MKAEKVARKFLLETKSKMEARQRAVRDAFDDEYDIEFLDLEASLVLWDRVSRNGLSWPYPGQHHFKVETEDQLDVVISNLPTLISEILNDEIFCFNDEWKRIGAFIANPKEVSACFSDLMWKSNDWLNIFRPDMKRGLLLDGDRTGSGDKLNYLQVYVYGKPWANKLTNLGLSVIKY